MNNWDKSLYLSTVALNSENKAMDKQGIYVESLEAKMNKLSASWDKFTTKSTDASFFKSMADGANLLLTTLEKLGVTLKTLLPIMGGVVLSNIGVGGKKPELFNKIGNAFKNTFKYPIASLFGKDLRGRGNLVSQLEKAAPNLSVKVKEVTQNIAQLGKTSETSSGLIKKLIKSQWMNAKNFEDVEDKLFQERMKIYTQEELTDKEVIEAERALDNARRETVKTSYEAAHAETLAAKQKWKELKKIDPNSAETAYAKQQYKGLKSASSKMFATEVFGAVGTGLAVGSILSSVAVAVADGIKSLHPEALDTIEREVAKISKTLQESGGGYTQAKESLELLDKIVSQTNETAEFTEDMREQLGKVIDGLDKSLGLTDSLIKSDEKGNLTLLSLKEVVEKYYGKAAEGEDLLSEPTKNALEKLGKVASTTGYGAYGKKVDWGAYAADQLLYAGGGATAGAALGTAAPVIGNALGAALGALLGEIVVGVKSWSGDYHIAGEVGRYDDIEEAIKVTKANLEKEKNERVAKSLQEDLERLENTKAQIDELVVGARVEAASKLSIIGTQEAKALRAQAITETPGTKATLTSADKSMIDNIISLVTQSMTAEQLLDKDYKARVTELEKEMVKARFGAADDLKASYTQFALKFEKGGEFADLLKGIDVSANKIEAIVSQNLPTLAKAASELKNIVSKIKEDNERASKKASAESNLLNNLSNMGFSLNMSAEDVNKMLNLGGEVDTTGILDPAYRKYAKDMADLYKEYWGENGKIASATYLQDQEQLIQEYERGVSLKQKEYEILQKQLEVQEAQNKLMQARRERDTLVFRNGRFMYEANPATIQGLTEEQEKKEREMEQMQVQANIESHTKDILDEVDNIASVMAKLESMLSNTETGMAPAELLQMLQDDLEDNGLIDDKYLKLLFKQIESLSTDYQTKLWNWLGVEPEEIAGKYDSGGLLKGQGVFRKDSIGDEVILSPTDAPQILSLLRNTSQFTDTVHNADKLLRSIVMRNGEATSLLDSSSGGNTIYNVENVNVEEASDIESILDSAQRQINMTNPKFIRR